ncbi:MAG: hypothetical protein JWO95_1590 [Verrucomicrobiales bacterium]|nr:hypothetical protein [Verrucomicrobiales bacterium]
MKTTGTPVRAESSFVATFVAKVASLPSEVRTGWYRLVPVSIGLKNIIFRGSSDRFRSFPNQTEVNRSKPNQNEIYRVEFQPINGTAEYTKIHLNTPSRKNSAICGDLCPSVVKDQSTDCLTSVAASASLTSAVRSGGPTTQSRKPISPQLPTHSNRQEIFCLFPTLRVLCRFAAFFDGFVHSWCMPSVEPTTSGVFGFTASDQPL